MSLAIGPATNSILFPSVGVAANEAATVKSVKLEFSPTLGFQASILCRNVNPLMAVQNEASLVKAKVETQFTAVDHFKDKISRMPQREAETYFLTHFDLQIEKESNSFKVILAPKSTSSHHSSVIRSTKELAEQLNLLPVHDPHYSTLQGMALAVIEAFAQTQIKTKPLIEEVTALALASNTLVTKALLKILVKEIKQGELLDVDLLKALKVSLIHSLIEALDPDDLIQVLKITMDRITKIHQQDKTSYKLYAALSTLSDILDVMGDAKVIQVDRIDLHDPLYKILDTLSDDDDLLIASQAAYAKQALVRVPNDESKVRSLIRHGTALVQGFASLYKVLSDQDVSALLDSYQSFREAVDFQQRKKGWYGDVRILKLLVDKNLFKKFSGVIEKEIKETSNPHVAGNVLVLLYDIAHHHLNVEARKWALDLMEDLFLNDARWGDKKKVKKEILAKMLSCASLPDQQISDYTKKLLGSLEVNAKTKLQKGILFAELPEDLKEIAIKNLHQTNDISTTLITAAQRSQYLSLDQKIEQLKEKSLNDEFVTKELATYIPVQGSRSFFDPKEKTFDLDQAMATFLHGNHPVFLLAGDSGGGKSTYLHFLERKLWQNWDPKKPIPLFIGLPSLKSPFNNALEEALKREGFSPQECKELKANYRFLFLLDGYDELKSRQNFYIKNKLHEWKGQAIITCRTQYLMGDQTSYQNFFLPQRSNLITTTRLDEASVSPFTNKEVEAYCRKFIELHRIPRTWEQYQQDLASVPDLHEIIETPFLLRIIAEVLPELMEKHRKEHGSEKLHLLRIEIFDAFVKNLFDREELRLMNTGAWEERTDIKKLFSNFSKALASKMIEAGLVAVDYEDNFDPFNKTVTPWAEFFGPDPRLSLIRSGVPLRKLSPNTYAFIHKSLLEYFGARAIVSNTVPTTPSFLEHKSEEREIISNKPLLPPLPKPTQPVVTNQISNTQFIQKPIQPTVASSISYKTLNAKLLVDEPEIIRFLAETVNKNPSLENSFFSIIERSKTDPNAQIAAANAITILKAAGVNLSLRDFKGIRIPGADLSYALLTNTDLSHAVLRNVRMTGATLDYSTLASSETSGLEFGQKPFLNFGSRGSPLAISYDGKQILARKSDGIELWDYETGKRRLRFPGYRWSLCAAFSPDAKRFLAAGENNTIYVWNCETGEELPCLHGHTDKLDSAVFSPDGKYVLSGSEDKTVRLWDLETAKEKLRLQTSNRFLSVAFSPDGKQIFGGGMFKIYPKDRYLFSEGRYPIYIWDCETGEELPGLDGHTGSITSIAVSPDRKYVLSGSMDHSVRLWDLETRKEAFCLQGHSDGVPSLAFSPDSKEALSGSYDKIVRLWDLETGKERLCLQGHSDSVLSVAFSLDGKQALSGSHDGTMRLWDIGRTNTFKWKQPESTGRIRDFAISHDGKEILSGDDTARIWDSATGKVKSRLQWHTLFSPRSVAFSHDGKSSASGSGDGTIELWDCETGKEKLCLEGHTDTVASVAFSSDDKWIISGSNDHTVRIWDCQTGKEKLCLKGHADSVRSIAVSPDDKWVLSGSHDKTVRLWNCETGEEKLCLEGHTDWVTQVAFSSDGKKILSGGADHTVRIWDRETGREQLLGGHTNAINSIAFSPDDRWVLSGSYDKTVRLWDSVTGKELYRLPQGFAISGAKFLPDRRHIVLATEQPSLQLWQLFTEKGDFKPALLWTTSSSTLSASSLNLEGVKDLSESNRRLLIQHGAKNSEEENRMSSPSKNGSP